MLNRRLVDRFSLRNLLRIATSCALAFALLLLLFNIGNFRSLWAVVFPMLLILIPMVSLQHVQMPQLSIAQRIR